MNDYYTVLSILTIIDYIYWIGLIVFFIAFVVRLILFFVRKGSLSEAEDKMNVANRKLRKLKKKENVDKDELEDLQDEVDDAYAKYERMKSAVSRHKHAWIRNISIFAIIFVVHFIIGIGAYYYGMNSVKSSLNSLGTPNYSSSDGWSVRDSLNSERGAKTLNDLGTYTDSY